MADEPLDGRLSDPGETLLLEPVSVKGGPEDSEPSPLEDGL